REVCNSALSIRNTYNIRIRQPLNSITIYYRSSFTEEYQEMIKDEVNVKKLELVDKLEGIASQELKLNFPLLGKRMPNKIQNLIQCVKQGKWKQIEN
ncbi:MAG TPA: hypothetical protein DEQ74_02040, partial [Wolbachia sp.]|nr:hypothetical protein [Wolbachia sp.]